MNLREAIGLMDRHKDSPYCMDGFREVLAAARRELERQEKEKPKRASLAELEDCVMQHLVHGDSVAPHDGGGRQHRVAIANILKALRETVVPWLRSDGWGRFGVPGERSTVAVDGLTPRDMLRALGEEP